jgi:hypothetical protein
MKNRYFASLLVGLSILFTVVPGQSQSQPQDVPKVKNLNDWLNQELQAKLNQRSNTKQTESPSQSGNSTSLVDQSSATDLISAALNLAGINQANGNGTTPQSFSVTASAYSVYALIHKQDPLDATFYNKNAGWRRVSFTLGQDNGSTTATSTTPRATIAGIKLLVVNRRDFDDNSFKDVRGELLPAAAAAFGNITLEIQIYLLRNETVQANFAQAEWVSFRDGELDKATADRAKVTARLSQATSDDEKKSLLEQQKTLQAQIERLNDLQKKPLGQLFDPDRTKWTREEKKYFGDVFVPNHMGDTFLQVLALVGDSGLNDIRQIINRRVDVFPSLDKAIRTRIEEIRKKPQFSLAFTSTTRPENGANEYVAEAIFDYGVANRINLTLNDNFTYKDPKTLGGITRGSKFVGDLQFQLNQEKRLSGRAPVTFDTAVEGDWMTKTSPTYKGQLKLKIPIAEGIDLPVSVTFANKTDLIKEKDVIGKFGFTFDTAKLLSLFSK